MFIIVYIIGMYQIFKTENYLKWFKKLRDNTAKYAIILRIERLKNGNFGDSKSVGEKVFELRIDTGKGYRVYFTNKDKEIIILLVKIYLIINSIQILIKSFYMKKKQSSRIFLINQIINAQFCE